MFGGDEPSPNQNLPRLMHSAILHGELVRAQRNAGWLLIGLLLVQRVFYLGVIRSVDSKSVSRTLGIARYFNGIVGVLVAVGIFINRRSCIVGTPREASILVVSQEGVVMGWKIFHRRDDGASPCILLLREFGFVRMILAKAEGIKMKSQLVRVGLIFGISFLIGLGLIYYLQPKVSLIYWPFGVDAYPRWVGARALAGREPLQRRGRAANAATDFWKAPPPERKRIWLLLPSVHRRDNAASQRLS